MFKLLLFFRKQLVPCFDKPELVPRAKCVVPGLYVMAQISWGTLPARWYRVRIINYDLDFKRYRVI